jgi:hypothetical protein
VHGAAGTSAVVVSAAVSGLRPNTTYHYRLVASNPDGSATGPDANFRTRPILVAASLSPKVFAVGGATPAGVAAAARVRKGTTIKYTLSEAARVSFTVERVSPGRRVGSRCVRPTRATQNDPHCTRLTKIGSFAANAPAGVSRRLFSGRLGSKSLSPGSYRLVLVAKDAARNVSAAKQLSFKIVAS